MGRHLKKEQINHSTVGRKMGREGEGRRGEKSWLEGREEIRKGEMKSKRRSRKKKRRTYLN